MASQDHFPRHALADQARSSATVLAVDDHEHEIEHDHSFEWPEAARIAFVAVASAAVWFRVWEPIQSVSVIGAIGLLVGGWPIFREALENLISRRMPFAAFKSPQATSTP